VSFQFESINKRHTYSLNAYNYNHPLRRRIGIPMVMIPNYYCILYMCNILFFSLLTAVDKTCYRAFKCVFLQNELEGED
jgi:hypothetical protein